MKKNSAFIVFIFLLSSSQLLIAQDLADSVKVDALKKEGLNILYNGRFEQAKSKLEASNKLAKELKLWKRAFSAEIGVIKCYWRLGNLEIALAMSKEMLIRMREKLGENTYLEAVTYGNMGSIYRDKSKLEATVLYFQKAIKIFQEYGKKGQGAIATIYSNMSGFYNRLGYLDKGQYYILKSNEIIQSLYGNDHTKIVYNLMAEGDILANTGLYDESSAKFEEALAMLDRLNLKGWAYADIVTFLGVNNIDTRNFQKADNFLKIGLDFNLNSLPEQHPLIGISYYYIGTNLYHQGLYDSAGVVFKKFLEYEKQLESYNPLFLSDGYPLIVDVLVKQDKKKSAIFYNQKMLSLAKSKAIKGSGLGIILFKGANFYFQIKDTISAKMYLKESFEIFEADENVISHQKGYPLLLQGEIHAYQGDFEDALSFIQEGMLLNCKDCSYGEENIGNIIDYELHKELLMKKVDILVEAYETTGRELFLNKLYESFKQVEFFANEASKRIINKVDKQSFNIWSQEIYTITLKVFYTSWLNSGKKKEYIERAFHYSEVGKATVLTNSLNTKKAAEWTEIPENLKSLERETRAGFNHYISLLANENREKGSDSIRLRSYQSKVLEFERRKDSIERILENRFPQYYQIKYDQSVIPLEEVQKKLSNDEAVLEYFISDSANYVFYITQNEYGLKKMLNEEVLLPVIEGHRKSMEGWKDQNENQSDSLNYYSYQLYQSLIAPFEEQLKKEKIKKLTIIPDGELGYLPFETFLTSEVAVDNSDLRAPLKTGRLLFY